jgi:hypothetical protein
LAAAWLTALRLLRLAAAKHVFQNLFERIA